MKSFPNLARNAQKGFTLFEVLIVIVVLGIISAIAVPTFNNSIERAASVKLMDTVTNNIADATRSLIITTGVSADNIDNIAKGGLSLLNALVEGKAFVEATYQLDFEDASISKLSRQVEIVTNASDGVDGVYKVGDYVIELGNNVVTFIDVPRDVFERFEQERDGALDEDSATSGSVQYVSTGGESGSSNLTISFDV